MSPDDVKTLAEQIKEYLKELKETETQQTILAIKEHCATQQALILSRLEEGGNKFIIHEKDISNLKEKQDDQQGCLNDIKTELKNIRQDLNDMKHDYIHGRPSWTVLVIVGIAISIISAFIGGVFW